MSVPEHILQRMKQMGMVKETSSNRIASYKPLKTTTGNKDWDTFYDEAGKENDIDPNLLVFQGGKETRFRPEVWSGKVASPKGALGPGQFMPDTAREFGLITGSADYRTDPKRSISAQGKLMRKLLDRTGDIELSLAGYNAGHNFSVEDLKRVRKSYVETRGYVDEIIGNYKKLDSEDEQTPKTINDIRNEIFSKIQNPVSSKPKIQTPNSDSETNAIPLPPVPQIRKPVLPEPAPTQLDENMRPVSSGDEEYKRGVFAEKLQQKQIKDFADSLYLRGKPEVIADMYFRYKAGEPETVKEVDKRRAELKKVGASKTSSSQQFSIGYNDILWHTGLSPREYNALPSSTKSVVARAVNDAVNEDERKKAKGISIGDKPNPGYQKAMRMQLGINQSPITAKGLFEDLGVDYDEAVVEFREKPQIRTDDLNNPLSKVLGTQPQERAEPIPLMERMLSDRAKLKFREDYKQQVIADIEKEPQLYRNFLLVNRSQDSVKMREAFAEFQAKGVEARYGSFDNYEEAQKQEAARAARIANMGKLEYAAQVPKSGVLGFTDAISSGVKSLAVLSKALDVFNVSKDLDASDLWLYQIGEKAEKGWRDVLGSNPDLEQEFGVGKVPTVFGQIASFALGGWASKSPKLATIIIGGGMMASDAYEEVKKRGGTDNEAVFAGLLTAGLLAPTELIGMRGIFSAIEGTAVSTTWKQALKTALKTGSRDMVENAAQEMFQEWAQGKITGVPRSIEQLLEAGALGAIGSFGTTTPLTAINEGLNVINKSPADVETETDEGSILNNAPLARFNPNNALQQIPSQDAAKASIPQTQAATPTPAPESAFTLEAQTEAAQTPDNYRVAVLQTKGDAVPELSKDWVSLQTPKGILHVNLPEFERVTGLQPNINQVKKFLQKNRKDGVEKLIGKVEPVADTSQGNVLRTEDAKGRELSSSIVTTPETAAQQAQEDISQFPQAANQQILSVPDAIAKRNAEVAQESQVPSPKSQVPSPAVREVRAMGAKLVPLSPKRKFVKNNYGLPEGQRDVVRETFINEFIPTGQVRVIVDNQGKTNPKQEGLYRNVAEELNYEIGDFVPNKTAAGKFSGTAFATLVKIKNPQPVTDSTSDSKRLESHGDKQQVVSERQRPEKFPDKLKELGKKMSLIEKSLPEKDHPNFTDLLSSRWLSALTEQFPATKSRGNDIYNRHESLLKLKDIFKDYGYVGEQFIADFVNHYRETEHKASVKSKGNIPKNNQTTPQTKEKKDDTRRIEYAKAVDEEFDALFGEESKPKEKAPDYINNLKSIFGDDTELAMARSRPEDFNEETYERAKSSFIESLKDYGIEDVRGSIRKLLTDLKDKYGFTPQQILKMKPYITEFLLDVEDGVIKLSKPTEKESVDSNVKSDKIPRSKGGKTDDTGRDSRTGTTGGTRKSRRPADGNVESVESETVRGDEKDGDASAKVQDASASARPSGKRSGRTDESTSGNTRDSADERAASHIASDSNYVITEKDLNFEGVGEKTRFRQNIEAIKLLKKLEEEERSATTEEQSVLAKYVGWGGIKNAFNPDNPKWSKEYNELKELLTPEEYRKANRTILDAHYTSRDVVNAIWMIAARLGFKQGKVLETSLGIGNFFGLMPTNIRGLSRLVGVEHDNITGGIAKQLYPNAKIYAPVGFEEVVLPADSVDIVVGNPPFGNEVLYDKNHKDISSFKIHAFFIAKAIDKLRPSGLLTIVVSKGFLDATDPQAVKARQYIAKRANLVGAIRLPNNAFSVNANTDVTTDIIVLQKYPKGTKNIDESWAETRTIEDSEGRGKIFISKYFAEHPEMMLGKMTLGGKLYAGGMQPTLEPNENQNLAEDLNKAISKLPKNIFKPAPTDSFELAEYSKAAMAPENLKPYNFYIDDTGDYFQKMPGLNEESIATPVKFSNEKDKLRLRGMIYIRDSVRSLIEKELDPNVDEATLQSHRNKLNKVYDEFVNQYGFLSSDVNKRVFRQDADFPLLLSLEKNYNKGISKEQAKKLSVASKEPTAQKSDIFKKRTINPVRSIETADSAEDALFLSLNEKGKFDLAFAASLLRIAPDELIAKLGDKIYEDPNLGWQTKEEYLSGDVKSKLETANRAAKENPRFERNIAALEEIIPEDIPAYQIGIRLGSSWIPAETYSQFVSDFINGEFNGFYSERLGRWLGLDITSNDSVLNTNKWGTPRASATKIIATLLTNNMPVVKDPVDENGKIKYVVNAGETEKAVAKAEELQEAFDDWIWKDAQRVEQLQKIYNEKYNRTVERKFNGSYLKFPGMNPTVTLRPHQKKFVARVLQTGKALADHVVGAGKTFAAVAIAMEARRLNLAKKPMITVPNHLVEQWAKEVKHLYPNASVLAATKKDFKKSERQQLFAKIATGDWDLVVVAHSSFKFIPVPEEVEREFLQNQINEITEAIEQMKRDRNDKHVIRDMEKIKANIEAKIAKIADIKRDNLLDFREMGVDFLMVDELHEFKNLFFYTSRRGTSGLGDPKGSQRAFDLFMKTRLVQESNGERNFVGLTGTPVSNSISEVFHMMRYFMYPQLERKGLHTFDGWAGVFGQEINDFQMDAANNLVQRRRFARFFNLPELKQDWDSVADVITREDLINDAKEQGMKFPLPKVKVNKVVVPRSPHQAKYIGEPHPVLDENGNPEIDPETGIAKVEFKPGTIVYRLDNWKEIQQHQDPRENVLRITGDARKAGLDYRLIDENAPDYEFSKVNKAVENIFDTYKENDSRKGTQLVFCDLSVPTAHKGKATEKAAEKRPVYFIQSSPGKIEHVAGVPVTLAAAPDLEFFGQKKGKDYFIVERTTGLTISKQSSKKEAVDAANGYITEKGLEDFEREVNGNLIQPELIDDYIARWELEQELKDDETEDSDDEQIERVSADDLLADAGKSSFSVYDDIKEKLIKRGVPANEIAFIHDFNTDIQKQNLFDKVNAGDIRILLGSTSKMGAGMNVQQRLVALHNLDVSWKPSDMEQRNGRIIRQGNLFYEADPDNFTVDIFNYATEQTYDARMWEINEQKGTSIDIFKRSGKDVREIEDVSQDTADAAEMKASASGDPRIMELVKLNHEIKKLERAERGWKQGRGELQKKIQGFEQKSVYPFPQMRKLEAALEIIGKNPKTDEAQISVFGETYAVKDTTKEKKADELTKEIAKTFKAMERDTDKDLGSYRGFNVTLNKDMSGNLNFYVEYDNRVLAEIEYDLSDPDVKFSWSGFVRRLNNLYDEVPKQYEKYGIAVERLKNEAETAREELKQGFPKQAELSEMRTKLRELRGSMIKKAKKAEGEQDSEDDESLAMARTADLDAAMSRIVDKYIKGEINTTGVVEISPVTPKVLQALGANNHRIFMPVQVFNKATDDKHHVDIDTFRKLPSLISRPVAVFDSNTVKGAFVVLVDADDTNGRPIIATIHSDKKVGRYIVNEIASFYAKGRNSVFQDWLDKGLLRYVDETKMPVWATSHGLQLLREVQSKQADKTILTQDDIVKKKTDEEPLKSARTPEAESELDSLRGADFDHNFLTQIKVEKDGDKLKINAHAVELLRRISEEIKIRKNELSIGDEAASSFDGKHFLPKQAKEHANIIKELANEALNELGYSMKDVRELVKLGRLFDEAAKRREPLITYIFKDAVPHEQIHRGSYLAADMQPLKEHISEEDYDNLLIDDIAQKVYDNYLYQFETENKYVRVQETAAWVAGNIARENVKELGITEEEGLEFLEKFFTAYTKKNGYKSIAKFEEQARNVQDVIERVAVKAQRESSVQSPKSKVGRRREIADSGEGRKRKGSDGRIRRVSEQESESAEEAGGDVEGVEESQVIRADEINKILDEEFDALFGEVTLKDETGFAKRSFPETLRKHGFDSADLAYQIYTNKIAVKEAREMLEKYDLSGAVEILQTVTNPEPKHTVLLDIVKRALDNAAAEVADTDARRAAKLKSLSSRLSDRFAEMFTEAGQFINSAKLVSGREEDTLTAAAKIAENLGKELSENEAQRFKRLGSESERLNAEEEKNALDYVKLQRKIDKAQKELEKTLKETSQLKETIEVQRKESSKLQGKIHRKEKRLEELPEGDRRRKTGDRATRRRGDRVNILRTRAKEVLLKGESVSDLLARIKGSADAALMMARGVNWLEYDNHRKTAINLTKSEWADLFVTLEPEVKRIKEFQRWLKSNPNAVLRLYHGTSAEHDIENQGLLKTSARRRNSLQSTSGYVYLSVYQGNARMFGTLAYPQREIRVYAVDVPVGILEADRDQLFNRRLYATEDVGDSLAESLVFGHSARVKRNLEPFFIAEYSTFGENDPLMMARPVKTPKPKAQSPKSSAFDFAAAREDLIKLGTLRMLEAAPGEFSTDNWRDKMREDVGEEIEPFLEEILAQSQENKKAALRQARFDRLVERIANEEGNENLDYDELKELAARRIKEQRNRKMISAQFEKEARKFFKSKELSPVEKEIAKESNAEDEILKGAARLSRKQKRNDFITELKNQGIKDAKAEQIYSDSVELLTKAKRAVQLEKDERSALKNTITNLEEERDRAFAAMLEARKEKREIVNEIASEFRKLKKISRTGKISRAYTGAIYYGLEALDAIKSIPLTLMATGDQSNLLRQGGIGIFLHPTQIFKQFLSGFKTLWLPKRIGGGFEEVAKRVREMESDEDFPIMQQMGIEFAITGQNLHEGEELFRGKTLLRKIPVVKQTVVKAVERAEDAFAIGLDLQRFHFAKLFIEQERESGVSFRKNPETYKEYGKHINIMTGRGDVSPDKRVQSFVFAIVKAFSFAPKYRWSRLQWITTPARPEFHRYSANAKRRILKDYLNYWSRFGALMLLGAGAGLLTGAMSVGFADPDDPDFLKLKVGEKIRLDLSSGNVPQLRFLLKLAFEASRMIRGTTTPKESGKFAFDSALRWVRSGADPRTSLLIDYMSGEDFTGKPFKWSGWDGAIATRMMPLAINGAIRTYNEEGVGKALAQVGAEYVGLSTSVYKERPESAKSEAEKLGRRILLNRLESMKTRTLEETELQKTIDDLRARARKGEDVTNDVESLVAQKKITPEKGMSIIEAKNKTLFQDIMEDLSLDELKRIKNMPRAGNVLPGITEDELNQLEPILRLEAAAALDRAESEERRTEKFEAKERTITERARRMGLNEALELYDMTTDAKDKDALKRVIGGKIVAQHRAGTLTAEDRANLKQRGIRVTLPPNRVRRKPEKENKKMPRGVYFQ